LNTSAKDPDWRSRAAELRPIVEPIIDGARVAAATDAEFKLENPFTGACIAVLPDCAQRDVDKAVASARRAFLAGVWCDQAPRERARVLQRWADLILREGDSLALLDTVQMGMPIGLSAPDIQHAAQVVRNFAELVDHTADVVVPSASTALALQLRRPQGVVAAISPWNFPIGTALSLLAPALAAGNSVILKPSEIAPLACLRLVELALEAGVPSGVVSALPGRGATTGRALASHMDVDCVGFIGSTATGQLLTQYAGQSNLKSLLLECGGKSPQIVFDDVGDINALADALVTGFTINSGQICTSGSRILIADSLYDRLVPLLAKRVADSATGDPLDPATKLGPLASRLQSERFNAGIATAISSDSLLARGQVSGRGQNEVAAHLYASLDSTSPIVEHEIFGPVSTVLRFRDEQEAVALANASRYGLLASIWSGNRAVGQRVARALRAGFILVNEVAAPKDPGVRFLSAEPIGLSGQGAQGGAAGLAAYTRLQGVVFHFA
jgi:acyl-CoA reductase-like NAD-dependent aldehyde dehydrogenase